MATMRVQISGDSGRRAWGPSMMRGSLFWMLVAAPLLLAAMAPGTLTDLPFGVAWADDDDGDDGDDSDDGDGDGGGFGGSGGAGGSGGGFGGSLTGGGRGSGGLLQIPGVRSLFGQPRQRRIIRQRQAAPVQQADFAPAEIVALGLTEETIAVLETRGFAVEGRDELAAIGQSLIRLSVPGGTSLDDARAEVSALQPDAQIDFNHYYRAGSDTACTDPWCVAPRLVQWPLPDDVAAACPVDITIGIVDSGVNTDHEALRDAALEVVRLADPEKPESSRQHGTAVASLLVGAPGTRSPGLLPGTSIVAVDAFSRENRRDERMDAYTLVRALDLLAARDARVINLSLAGSDNALLARMISILTSAGRSIVAAAGNAGPRSEPAYPAAYDGVFAVTAIDANKRIYRRAGRGDHIDFAAPGVRVWAAASIRGAKPRTGTSFATPFVTAALAILHSDPDRDVSYEALKRQLGASAEDLGPTGFDDTYGYGLIQLGAACGVGPPD